MRLFLGSLDQLLLPFALVERFLQESIPVVGGPVFSEHLLENGIGVGLAPVGSEGFVVIHPSQDDDFCGRAVPEE